MCRLIFCVRNFYLSPSVVVSSVGSKVVVLLHVFVAPIVCAGICLSTGYVICFLPLFQAVRPVGLLSVMWYYLPPY